MPHQRLTTTEIEAALSEVGEALIREKCVVDVAIFGGAAILLQFEVSFRTQDVDATVISGDHGALMRAVHEVADRRGWLRSWFSDAVQNYVVEPVAKNYHASYPSEMRVGLRVYVAKPDYLLAMKLRAMRAGSRDTHDATILAQAAGVTTFEAMMVLLTQYFPKEPPDARRVAIIGQFAESLNAPPSPDAG